MYELLCAAHYRTSPLDLRRMMDAPGQHFAVAQAGAEIAGALWLVEEGGLPPALRAKADREIIFSAGTADQPLADAFPLAMGMNRNAADASAFQRRRERRAAVRCQRDYPLHLAAQSGRAFVGRVEIWWRSRWQRTAARRSRRR